MFDYIISGLSTSTNAHKYLLHASGIKMKDAQYNTRRDAEEAMYGYCANHNLHIECREYDKHERVYTNHEGVRFYINRI